MPILLHILSLFHSYPIWTGRRAVPRVQPESIYIYTGLIGSSSTLPLNPGHYHLSSCRYWVAGHRRRIGRRQVFSDQRLAVLSVFLFTTASPTSLAPVAVFSAQPALDPLRLSTSSLLAVLLTDVVLTGYNCNMLIPVLEYLSPYPFGWRQPALLPLQPMVCLRGTGARVSLS